MAHYTADDGCHTHGDMMEAMTRIQLASSGQNTGAFYSEANMKHLEDIIERIRNGTAHFEGHELIDAEDE